MGRKNKNTQEVEVMANEENTGAVAEAETPTGAEGTKNKKARGKVTPRDNGFRVLQTVNVPPESVIKSEWTGRAKAVPMEKVIELADNIRKFGQLQAIQVTAQGTPGQFCCVFGNTRLDAVELLKKGYTSAEGKEIPPQPNVTIRAEVVDCDDQTVILHKVIENEFRTGTNAIDKAKNQQILRDQFNMSDVKIAEYCQYASSATVSRLKKLLTLEQKYQDAVSDGTLTANAAFMLADKVEEKDRETVFAMAQERAAGEDSIGESAVKGALTAFKAKQKEEAATQTANKPAGETGSTETGTEGTGTEGNAEGTVTSESEGSGRRKNTISLTVKEFKELLTSVAQDDKCPDIVKTAMSVIQTTMTGETSPSDFAKWFAQNLK